MDQRATASRCRRYVRRAAVVVAGVAVVVASLIGIGKGLVTWSQAAVRAKAPNDITHPAVASAHVHAVVTFGDPTS